MNRVVSKKEVVQNDQQYSHKYLTFLLREKIFAVSILKVKEIIEYGTVTPIPKMPDFVYGAINLRGKVVPVIDLMQRLEGDECEISKRSCIIIVEIKYGQEALNMGIIVDAVSKVMDFNQSDIEAAPSFGGNINTNFIEGMGKINDQFVIILNINKILSMEDLEILTTSQAS